MCRKYYFAGLLSVAVIADRTAYDARYAGKLSNLFQLQVDERLHARSELPHIQPVGTLEFTNAPKFNPLKRE